VAELSRGLFVQAAACSEEETRAAALPRRLGNESHFGWELG